MANEIIDYPSSVYIPVAPGCCSEVYLCLTEEWAEKTVNLSRLVVATIENAGRQLTRVKNVDNIRCSKVYQYVLNIDLDQFLLDIRGLPYTPTCEDILEIMPYACTVSSLLSAIPANYDAVISVLTNGGLEAGTTPGNVQTTNIISYRYNDVIRELPITDDFWDLTGVSTGVGEYKKVLLQIDPSDNASIVEGDAAASQAAATLPDRTLLYTVVGYVEIGQSYAGGAISNTDIHDVTGTWG